MILSQDPSSVWATHGLRVLRKLLLIDLINFKIIFSVFLTCIISPNQLNSLEPLFFKDYTIE